MRGNEDALSILRMMDRHYGAGRRLDTARNLNLFAIGCAWLAGIIVTVFFVIFLALFAPRKAHAEGDWSNASPAVRDWFKSVKSPKGVPCCDISDGHRTDYDIRADDYWVPIEGTWMPVPKEAVVHGAGNPTGDAVVWFTSYSGKVLIRCFVPGSGT